MFVYVKVKNRSLSGSPEELGALVINVMAASQITHPACERIVGSNNKNYEKNQRKTGSALYDVVSTWTRNSCFFSSHFFSSISNQAKICKKNIFICKSVSLRNTREGKKKMKVVCPK